MLHYKNKEISMSAYKPHYEKTGINDGGELETSLIDNHWVSLGSEDEAQGNPVGKFVKTINGEPIILTYEYAGEYILRKEMTSLIAKTLKEVEYVAQALAIDEKSSD
jgi:hypothetical protein